VEVIGGALSNIPLVARTRDRSGAPRNRVTCPASSVGHHLQTACLPFASFSGNLPRMSRSFLGLAFAMSDDLLQTLPYRNGQLARTTTRLLVVHGKYVVQSLALKHITAVSTEEAQSFRHRVWVPSIGLYVAGNFAGNVALLAMFKGRAALGLVFMTFMCLYFLWGVITSQRILWLHVRYANVLKLAPLPGVDSQGLQQFVEILGERMHGRE
jgi:hypothetical protein